MGIFEAGDRLGFLGKNGEEFIGSIGEDFHLAIEGFIKPKKNRKLSEKRAKIFRKWGFGLSRKKMFNKGRKTIFLKKNKIGDPLSSNKLAEISLISGGTYKYLPKYSGKKLGGFIFSNLRADRILLSEYWYSKSISNMVKYKIFKLLWGGYLQPNLPQKYNMF